MFNGKGKYIAWRRALSLALALVTLCSLAAPAFGFEIAVVVTESAYEAGELTDGDDSYRVSIAYGEDARIPGDASLYTEELAEAAPYLAAAERMLPGDRTVEAARFFDIEIRDGEGEKIEPENPVSVTISAEGIESADVTVVHFPGSAETDAVPEAIAGKLLTEGSAEAAGLLSSFGKAGEAPASSKPLKDRGLYDPAGSSGAGLSGAGLSDAGLAGAEIVEAEIGEDGRIMFEADGFSVYGVIWTKTLVTEVLTDGGELVEVRVTYDQRAQIPDGATLKVTEFAEGTDAYQYAWMTVLADKQARGEPVDFTGLSALDISILDADGCEIEPAAPVQVDMTIKSLPGVENLNEAASTLTVRHHVETEDGIVVETVYEGGAEASFRLGADETVVPGTPVDPVSADLSSFDFSSFALYPDGTAAEDAPEDAESDEISVSFQTPVFSTFTVTWNDGSTTSNQMRVSQLSNGKYILYARDAGNNNYYALVPGTALNSVQVTLNGDLVQYSGSENLYWDVEVSGDSYYFSFTENGQKYYLAAGTTGNRVQTGTSKTAYGNADTTSWGQWSNFIHSAQDTFLQSYNGTFRTWNVLGDGSWQNKSLVYFEKEGAASGPHAVIHYVDENGNELTVSNGQPVNDTTSGLNYLIYDVEGYEYLYTYRNTDTTDNRITPILRYQNNRWRYTTGTNRGGRDYNSWKDLSSGDDIYVVYKPKAEIPEGGTPVPKVTGEKPETPTINKSSTVNHDGTNTLSLSVTGHTSIMEAEKLADVIVVFDVSGSMDYKMDKEEAAAAGRRRMDYAQTATKNLAASLLGKNTADHPDLIRMSLISFSNTAEKKQDFTTDVTTFQNAVTNLPSPNGGTNWEDALQMANEMAVASDRATFVVFVTDGNPTFRQARGVLNNSGTGSLGDNDVSGYYFAYNVYGTGSSDDHGRNYAAALTQARSIVSHGKNFYTIGISNDVTNLTKLTTEAGAGADHSKTATSNDELVAAFNEVAASVIAFMGHSDVQITDGITDMTQTVQKSALVNFVEDDFTYLKERLATQEEISDSSKVPEGAVIEDRDGIKYVVWNDWDPASEGCAEAEYENGAVVWNMGGTFMLEEGCTYQVHFKVWPSQTAYDLLADLNNGKRTYASLTDAEKAQISEPETAGGPYKLKTNSNTSYTYREATKSGETVTPTGDPSEPGHFPDVDPLELTTNPVKVKKQWENNYVDSRKTPKQVTMELYDADSAEPEPKIFKSIELKPEYEMVDGHYVDENGRRLDYNESTGIYEYEDGTEGTPAEAESSWRAENNYISYGLVTYNTETDSGEKVYEKGHDFTLRETDAEAHYYELTAGVFRPMYINGVPTILEKIDSAPAGMGERVFHYSDGTHHYYRLDGKIYRNTLSDTLMIATNSHRSYMDITKRVVDESGAAAVSDELFEFTVTFTIPQNIDNYETEQYIFASIRDENGDDLNHLTDVEKTDGFWVPSELAAEIGASVSYYSRFDTTQRIIVSGETFTMKIKPGWTVRFVNLPKGTTYSIQETNIPTEYNFVKAEVSGTRWIANMVEGTDQGSDREMTGLPVDNNNDGVSGTIDFANARYKAAYTNKTLTQQVIILKTDQGGVTPLPGAVFSLYTENGYTADPKQAAKTELTSDENGIIDLGALTYGKYYLAETSAPEGYILLSEPVEITVSASGVTYNQSGGNLSMSGEGIVFNPETGVYTLTVTNNAGYALPSTGGIGTGLFTLLGSVLTLGAALGAGTLLLRRRKCGD